MFEIKYKLKFCNFEIVLRFQPENSHAVQNLKRLKKSGLSEQCGSSRASQPSSPVNVVNNIPLTQCNLLDTTQKTLRSSAMRHIQGTFAAVLPTLYHLDKRQRLKGWSNTIMFILFRFLKSPEYLYEG